MKREGTVKWYKEEKGYGRIMLDEEEEDDVFVHFSSIIPDKRRFPNDFRYLQPGQKVLFDLVNNPNSNDQKRVAENVLIISD